MAAVRRSAAAPHAQYTALMGTPRWPIAPTGPLPTALWYANETSLILMLSGNETRNETLYNLHTVTTYVLVTVSHGPYSDTRGLTLHTVAGLHCQPHLCVNWWCLVQCRNYFLVVHLWYWEDHGVGPYSDTRGLTLHTEGGQHLNWLPS